MSSQPVNARGPSKIELPAPTAWPIIAAFGVALLFAGLVTSPAVSILGAILTVSGWVGWFRDVLPHEKHESLPVSAEAIPVVTKRPEVTRVDLITREPHRARLPLEIYPISAGVKGGLAGSVVMAVLAVIYGVVAYHSIWYPINILAAGIFPCAGDHRADLCVSPRRLYHRLYRPLGYVVTGWPALRCNASNVSAAANFVRRGDRSYFVVWTAAQRSPTSESRAQRPD